MSVLVVGLSHRSAPVEVLERAAVSAPDVPKLLDEMVHAEHVSEVMMLSTCNRIEVYAVVDAFHGGLADVSAVLSRHSGMPLAELTEHVYVHYAGSAVQHLFAVSAGLDSMVVGEAQILGQLRAAYATADETGTVGRALHELAQQSLRVGKRVHARTGIDTAGASVVSEALSDAATALGGDLTGRRAVLVGAGAMGALAAAHLRRAGAAEIVVLNRSVERAERLAATSAEHGTPARAGTLDALPQALADADLLLACTGAIGTVVERSVVAAAVAGRPGRPLAVCDLGLPRDVDAGVAALPGVTVVDLIALQARLSTGERGAAVAAAQELVAAEAQAYLAAQRSAAVTPTVTALRRRASEVIDAELLRLDAKLPDLDDRVREEFDRSVRRVVDKLLHTPTVQIKRLAEGPDGTSYAEALRELFELDPQTPAAVAVARSGDVLAALEARSEERR
ncbi:glutamyl-tRNA reductase [Pseudonocardia sp. KRD-184]|uniref:Glutamyl-tRNA reductase n=1 Tax=Pseudonocardia oceani TaxID=2792013 RepID=A0ABS6U7G0_9PSEU|nr:glutamyl-tRNA reductase [Pseudonocardia oceani]MBW0091924.1 glutamyl-tRNA reductase [Pseudonocardia oceani]MBW0099045.1 glutamyl-tRNA reductase [Pseudonocardia oceani]MBW0111523.1 glutamyl-tRNA reductase [Pseudonocardia oceani]MBW0125893.1 glutamyl-tRNA reductase [Pseudonocardia oceani]MBW0128167.1 glutamyl-tRNA reductase [Pseudonocardia oceani]